MTFEFAAFLAVLAAFSVYGVLSGIESAVSLMRVEPRLAPADPSKRIFTPRWEINNLLLAAGCVGLAALSGDAVNAIVGDTWPVLMLGLVALVLRAGSLFYVYLRKSAPGARKPNYVFAASSFVVPLSLGSAGIYIVTGDPFWSGWVGATLFAALVAGLLALIAAFIYYVGGKKAPQGVVVSSRLLNIVLAVLLALGLMGVLNGDSSHLLNLSYAYLAVIAAGIVLAQTVLLAARKEWRMWWCLAALAFLAPFLMGLANYPYLVYPDVFLGSPYVM